MGFIYKITNQITGKIYVGKTARSLEERYQEHIKLSNKSKHYLHRSIKKYGSEFFSIDLLEEVFNTDTLNEREVFWITQLNTLVPNGYNITRGGNGGDTSLSINYLIGMSKRDFNGSNNPMFGKRGENNPNYGSIRTDSQKTNLRNGLRRAWNSNPERKRKQSLKVMGENNPNFGKKPQNAITIKYNNKIYYSIADAVRDTNQTINHIKKHGDVINE